MDIVYSERVFFMKTMKEILENAKKLQTQTVAVAAPEDKASLEAICNAAQDGIVNAILVGQQKIIEAEIKTLGITAPKNIDFLQAETHILSAAKAVELVRNGSAQLLMKGTLHTDEILRAVLDKTVGLRTDRLLSHALIFEFPGYHKLLALADAAMNIAPDLSQKVQILQNTAEFMAVLSDSDEVKAAILAAVETVNLKMPATLDAAYIAKMSQRGQIKNVIADGPLALDNAVSAESAKIKGISSPVCGDPDILLVPDIEAGNILYKSLTIMAGFPGAGIILGSKAPVILTSRADDIKTKLYSIALGAMACAKGYGK